VTSYSNGGGSSGIDGPGIGGRSGGCRGDGEGISGNCLTSCSCCGDGMSNSGEGERSGSRGGDCKVMNRSGDRERSGSTAAIDGPGVSGRSGGYRIISPGEDERCGCDRIYGPG